MSTTKTPFIDHTALEALAQRFGTPFHLYSESLIRAKAQRLKAAFDWNPGFKEYFAVKANPNPVLLQILREEGCGADCSSLTELMLARACGFKGRDIMFSSNVTPEADMRLARELDACINLDDTSHIDFLDHVAGLPDTVMLRFNPGNSFTIGNTIMSRPGDAKYGCTRRQLTEGLKELQRRGVRHFGLHAFLSSNTTDSAYYPALAELLFTTAADLKKETGIAVESVNLSGGVGIPYKPEDDEADMEAIGRRIQELYRKILVPEGLGTVSIHTELGRWMMAEAGCLVARVLHTKHIHKNYLGLDTCAADLMRPAMYGAYHHISVSGKEDLPEAGIWDVTGGLCENNDKFALDRPLPPVGIGDLVIIHDTGAHGRSMGYNYNGKLRCGEVLLKSDGTTQLIRRAETPADYFATLDVLEGFQP